MRRFVVIMSLVILSIAVLVSGAKALPYIWLGDNEPLKLGDGDATDPDFFLDYDSTNGRLELRDLAGNLMLHFTDDGTTGTLWLSDDLTVTDDLTITGDVGVANVTATGTVQGEQLTSTDDLTVTDAIGAASVTATGTIQAEQLTSTDDIDATGDITAGGDVILTGELTSTGTPLYLNTSTDATLEVVSTGKARLMRHSVGNTSLDVYANNDASEDTFMGTLFFTQVDDTDGTEDSTFGLGLMRDGSFVYNLLTVAGSNGAVAMYGNLTVTGDIIGTDDVSVADDLVTQGGRVTTDGDHIDLEADRDGTDQVVFALDRTGTKSTFSRTDPGNLYHYWTADNDAAEATIMAAEIMTQDDDTDGSEDGSWSVATMIAGSLTYNRLAVGATGTAVAGTLTSTGGGIVGGVNSTTQGTLTLWDGSGGSLPAYVALASPNGTVWYLFVEDDGTLKAHSSAPTANADGSAVGDQTD